MYSNVTGLTTPLSGVPHWLKLGVEFYMIFTRRIPTAHEPS
jgi:hypothetical protein